MRRILVTNDDGVHSPTLGPLIEALRPLGEVRVVAPSSERSWIGKAISRFDKVEVWERPGDRIAIHAVTGTPADCVNLGVHTLFPDPPDLVVSGINLGVNFGTAFLLSSGTVGAAMEAWIAGVPSIAFSMAIPSDVYGLSGAARAERLGPRSAHAAATAYEIVSTILAKGFPETVDLFTVNFPAEVDPQTPRRITKVTRSRYGPLFEPAPEGGYLHRFGSYGPIEENPLGDIEIVRSGFVSITPIRLDWETSLPQGLRAALENSQS